MRGRWQLEQPGANLERIVARGAVFMVIAIPAAVGPDRDVRAINNLLFNSETTSPNVIRLTMAVPLAVVFYSLSHRDQRHFAGTQPHERAPAQRLYLLKISCGGSEPCCWGRNGAFGGVFANFVRIFMCLLNSAAIRVILRTTARKYLPCCPTWRRVSRPVYGSRRLRGLPPDPPAVPTGAARTRRLCGWWCRFCPPHYCGCGCGLRRSFGGEVWGVGRKELSAMPGGRRLIPRFWSGRGCCKYFSRKTSS